MKFIHIADIHLGAKPEAGRAYTDNRERELWDTFKRVIELCEKDQIELLLIAGDLFHRQPLLRELKEVDYMFSKLTYTKVVFIVGNHDYIKTNSYYGSYIWSDNVYPILSESLDCVEIEELEVAIYGCSYHQKEVVKEILQQPIELADQKYHILLGHGGDTMHMPFDVKRMKMMPYDYIALGHIHKPQVLIENRMAYAGALEPSDIADYGTHGFILGEIQNDGKVEGDIARRTEVRTRFITYASREYKRLLIEVHPDMTHYELKDYIQEQQKQQGMQHMYHVELTGKRNPDAIFDVVDLDTRGNIIRVLDNTKLHYDLEKLEKKNRENLLGAYIRSFGTVKEGSVEYMALYEGVSAIEETKKG